MRRSLRYLFSIFIFTISFSLCVFAQGGKDLVITQEANKVALVIGNSKYQNGFSQLSSPQNDAREMGEALKRLGFSLVGGKAHYDLTFRQMENLLDQFTEQIKRGGVGFFYFSGHGSQDNNRDNFLIPVDTQIKYQNDLKHLALKVELVTSRMEAAENRLNILVLDACRNNPLPSGFKSGNSGLNTSKDIPSGIYVAFAARDGQTAADGSLGGYSLYTEKLLQFIETPNERLEDIFINTRVAVKNETKNRQFPIDYGSLDGRVYFKLDDNISQNPFPIINKPKPTIPTSSSRSFSFNTPRTDANGNIVEQIPGTAYYEVEDLDNGVTLEMVEIKGYQGGKFWAGKYEVTQAQWKAVMGDEDFTKRKCDNGEFNSDFIGDNKPMICISWDETQEFIKKLNIKTGKKYRLPKEAEWEYASRGGITKDFAFGENITADLVNYDGNYPYGNAPEQKFIGHTMVTGSYPPNLFGLFDMYGNVWEWCDDRWFSSTKRIFRGGSWSSTGGMIKVRISNLPSVRNKDMGFRLFRS